MRGRRSGEAVQVNGQAELGRQHRRPVEVFLHQAEPGGHRDEVPVLHGAAQRSPEVDCADPEVVQQSHRLGQPRGAGAGHEDVGFGRDAGSHRRLDGPPGPTAGPTLVDDPVVDVALATVEVNPQPGEATSLQQCERLFGDQGQPIGHEAQLIGEAAAHVEQMREIRTQRGFSAAEPHW